MTMVVAYPLAGILFGIARLLITRPTHSIYGLWNVHGDYLGETTGWHFPGILTGEEVGVLFSTIAAIPFWPVMALVALVIHLGIPAAERAENAIGRLFGR